MKVHLKARASRVILLLLFLVGTASYALASAAHGDAETAHAKAVVEQSHNEAAAQQEHAVQSSADLAGHESRDGHAGEASHADSLSPAKLKDLFWRTLNFAALVALLVYFLGKPVASGLSGRQQRIKEELSELEAKKEAAEAEYAEFETKLAGMEQDMEQIVAKAIAQAENEKTRILKEAEKAADDIKAQAQAAIQAELEDVKRSLREEVADQAAMMAEEIIVNNLTDKDQVTITEQFLERVGAVQ
ncbi:MAG: hypothetical protein CSA32_02910 [Desulfobulbus propionicus]|nr:MAG: hypothetical protein CSA32_02910 [Desulfobulbus propionicus]